MIAIAGRRAIERAHAFGDHRAIPLAAILIAQQEQRAFGIDARGKPRRVQQHQRHSAHARGAAIAGCIAIMRASLIASAATSSRIS